MRAPGAWCAAFSAITVAVQRLEISGERRPRPNRVADDIRRRGCPAAPERLVDQDRLDRVGERKVVSGRHDRRPPPVAADHLAASAIVADDDRRAAQQRLERHQAEDLIARWVDDHVRGCERVETLDSSEQARPQDPSPELEAPHTESIAAPAPMSFPAITRTASARSSAANARTRSSTPLRGVSLPRKSTIGR